LQGFQGIQGATGPVAGSANQIVYKDGSNNPAGSNNLTFDGSNLYVGGNITIGGTTAFIAVNELVVKDKDIVLGIVTDSFGNDTSTDVTASSGGIAIASTEGTPLISMNSGGEITPDTYKQLMWFKSGTFTGLNTDAWIFNYGVGIGKTQIANGVRLAAGGMQVTDVTISTPQLNVSGVSTFVGLLELDSSLKDFYGQVGTASSVLISTGAGVSWANIQQVALQGTQGFQGFQGVQGAQGFQGVQGAQGFQGVQGAQGFQGVQGVQGAQGFQGVQGSQGFQGVQGAQGAQGFQGVQGASAATSITNNVDNYVVTATGNGTTPFNGEANFTFDGSAVKAPLFESTQSSGDEGGEIKLNKAATNTTLTTGVTIDVFQNRVRLFETGGTNRGGYWDVSALGAGVATNLLSGGSQGAQGAQGFQGFQGVQGAQGSQGFQGVQGAQGFQGVQGVQGSQGFQGVQGAQGFQGVQGAQGSQGFQGFQGVQGSQGFQGVQGAQGAQGFQGVQGAQGAQGSQGNQGIQGVQGAQGSQGAQGFQGVQGVQGAQGFQGVQGVQGSQGFQGVQGAQGFQGFQGVQGAQGAQGFQGLQGVQGAQGAQGFQGVQGVQGAQGSQGAQGFQGVQGVQGAQGAQGFQGFQGFQGVQGAQGFQGVQGVQGAQGFQGVQGASGPSTTISATDDTSATTHYPVFVAGTGNQTARIRTTTTALQFIPSSNVLSAANVYINTSTATGTSSQPLQVSGGAYISGNLGIGITNPSRAIDVTGNINASGTVTANSDEKLKTNIKTIENALNKVLLLRGVEYDRTDIEDHQIGVIAQEVEKVIPEVVYGEKIKSVAYSNMIGILIEAIKDLNQKIEEK
jgi:hypothetical protein